VVGYALALRMIRDHPEILLGHPTTATTSTTTGMLLLLPLIPSIQFAAFACLIQISTNLHNDYADFAKGADTHERVGQARATQRGWLTPHETCRGCVLCLCAAAYVGVRHLIPLVSPPGDIAGGPSSCSADDVGLGLDLGGRWGGGGHRYDPVMVAVVLSSMFNAVAYTGGPFPLGYVGLGDVSIGYSGLGDVFVFAYFGIVATMGVPYLCLTRAMTSTTSAAAEACLLVDPSPAMMWHMLLPSFLHSLPVGCLATAIIVVNNLRDRHTDVRAGKRTTAVRFGERFARIEYLVLVVMSYAFCACSCWWCQLLRSSSSSSSSSSAASRSSTTMAWWTALLPLASFPVALPQLRAVAFGGKDGQALNDHVGGTARLQMVYCVLLAAGLAISSSSS
jgi:1,4-dihydroxy-2-naphthoate octaprenyltransferase